MLVKMITKKYFEPIKSYKFVSDENKKYFLSGNPVIYEDMQGRQCCCDISDIKEFPEDRIHKVVGNLYILTEGTTIDI